MLPCFAPSGFFPSRKSGGERMGQDFSPAPLGGTGMGLDFLDPSRPTHSRPRPALLRVIIVNFSYPKTLLFKQTINISLFYSIQCGSLPLFYHVLYYEIFIFYNCLVKHLDILFNFF